MRLLFVDASRNGWGTEQHLVSLAKALADNGHDVAVVARRGSPVADLLVVENIRTVAIPFRGGLDPRGIAATVRELRRYRPHWIITNRAKLYWTVLLLGRLFGVRVALFRHMPDVRSWWTRCVLPHMADAFFVVSDFARSRLAACGAPAHRIRVLHNPINVEHLRRGSAERLAMRLRLGIPRGDFVIGFVGRVELEKGVRVLWDTLLPLMARASRVRVLCVGDGPELGALQCDVDAAGLAHRCHFVGWTDSVRPLYAAMDLLIAPSIAIETFCRVIAEAQAMNLPVIGSRIGGIPEALLPGYSGLLVPPADRRALHSAILEIYSDPALCERMGAAGRRYASKQFHAQRIAADFVNSLQSDLKLGSAAVCGVTLSDSIGRTQREKLQALG